MIDIFDDKFQKDNFFEKIDDIEKLGIIEEEEKKKREKVKVKNDRKKIS